MLGTRHVTEGMPAEVAHGHAFRQRVRDERSGRLGQHDLAAVSGRRDARRPVHLEPAVVVAGQVGLARMQSHPDAQIGPVGPRIGDESSLRGDRRGDGGARLGEDGEDGVALGAHGDAAVLVDLAPDDAHV